MSVRNSYTNSTQSIMSVGGDTRDLSTLPCRKNSEEGRWTGYRSYQALLIEPRNLLIFKAPFDCASTCLLMMTNPTHRRVAFKIKTNAFEHYFVRPKNSGFLEPSKKVIVSLQLRPTGIDEADKGNHKFMIQSAYAPENYTDIDELYNTLGEDRIMKKILRCVLGKGCYNSFESVEEEIANKFMIQKKTESDVQDKCVATVIQEATTPRKQLISIVSAFLVGCTSGYLLAMAVPICTKVFTRAIPLEDILDII